MIRHTSNSKATHIHGAPPPPSHPIPQSIISRCFVLLPARRSMSRHAIYLATTPAAAAQKPTQLERWVGGDLPARRYRPPQLATGIQNIQILFIKT